MFRVYVLYSEVKKRYYVGHTDNLDKRVSRHNRGLVKSTKSGIPWNISYSEEFLTKQDAYRREMQIKSYKGGEAFKKLVALV